MMIHISVIVWALCMLQSVSAFAPEPSSDEITPVAAQFSKLLIGERDISHVFRGQVTTGTGIAPYRQEVDIY